MAAGRETAGGLLRCEQEFLVMREEKFWTDEKITALRELWASGMPTAEIGRELKVSKSAVVGKAHRLGLDTRPSPIAAPLDPDVIAKVKDLLQCGRTPKEVSIVTGVKHATATSIRWRMGLPKLPPQRTMARIVPRRPLVVRVQPAMPPIPTIHLLAPAKPVIPTPAPLTDPASIPRAGSCLWPMWGHRERPRFLADGGPDLCGAARCRGSYCDFHRRIAYTQVREQAA